MTILIEIQDLQIKIANRVICEKVNLCINSGEVWGIIGPNGAGKTTLLHSLCGLRDIDFGRIYLNTKNLSQLTPKAIAKQLGILLQESSEAFSQTVYEFCLTGRHPHLKRFSRESAQDHQHTLVALEQMELTAKSQHYASTLSGGEQRRLNIATLLNQAPQIYLLDEPTNHLDIRHQIETLNIFKKLAGRGNAAIVMTLHDINLAAHYCDNLILLFANGEHIVGPSTTLLNAEVLTRLYQHPLRKFSDAKTSLWLPDLSI